MKSVTGRTTVARLRLLVVMVMVAVVTVAGPVAAVTVEWEQNESYYFDDVAFSDDGDVQYVATNDGIVVLDRTGSPIGSFSVPVRRLDAAGDRLLVIGVDEPSSRDAREFLTVLDIDGNVVTSIEWSGPSVLDVAILGTKAVLILGSEEPRVEMFDLETLTPLGVLASFDHLSTPHLLGVGGDTLLVTVAHYYIDEEGKEQFLKTTVSVYENLAFIGTVTLTDPAGHWFHLDVVPGEGGMFYGLNIVDSSLGVGIDRDLWTGATVYDENGSFVETVWTTPGHFNGGIGVDGCFGLVGAVSRGLDLQVGFKYVPDDRNPPCFVDTLDNIFNNAVIWLGSQEITKGCNPPLGDRFCPDDYVTRGQMAAFLSRALGYTDDGGGGRFTDTQGHLFETAIDKLATAGVTKGCNPPLGDRFCPDDYVTRGQMAAFLVRAMGYTDNGGGSLFTDDDGHLFENAIDNLGAAKVTLGCNPPTNDKFCPDDTVTRGQMAAFLKRALG